MPRWKELESISISSEAATTNVTVDVPREGDIQAWGFVCNPDPTDVGISNGENFEGLVNRIEFLVNNTPFDTIEQNELAYASDILAEGIFSDQVPVTTVAERVFYIIPLPKTKHGVNSWRIRFDLKAASSEWGAASAFTCTIRPFVIYGPIKEGLRLNRVAKGATTSPRYEVPQGNGPVVGTWTIDQTNDYDVTLMKLIDKDGLVEFDGHGDIAVYLNNIAKRVDPVQASVAATPTANRISAPGCHYSGRILHSPSIGGQLQCTKSTSAASVAYFLHRYAKVRYAPISPTNTEKMFDSGQSPAQVELNKL